MYSFICSDPKDYIHSIILIVSSPSDLFLREQSGPLACKTSMKRTADEVYPSPSSSVMTTSPSTTSTLMSVFTS